MGVNCIWEGQGNLGEHERQINLCFLGPWTSTSVIHTGMSAMVSCTQKYRHAYTHTHTHTHGCTCRYMCTNTFLFSSVWRWTGGEGGEGEGMKQLSSRDCDKWFSMTFSMKERFFSVWRGGTEENSRAKQLEGSVASVASRVYWLRERHFKTQSTFLVSLNGFEAKGLQYSLPPLEILQWSLLLWLLQKKSQIHTVQIALSLFPCCSDRDTKMNVLHWCVAAVALLKSLSDHWKSAVSNMFTSRVHVIVVVSHYREW